MSYTREHEGAEAADFEAAVDFTDETAEANPDWTLDLSDQEIGHWRGPEGRRGVITLVWGVALVPNGAVATAELGPTTTDQCELVEDRFTLVSLDDYTGDYIEVALSGRRAPSWRRVAVRGRRVRRREKRRDASRRLSSTPRKAVTTAGSNCVPEHAHSS